MTNVNTQIAMSAILRHLGIKLSVEDKASRLAMQKAIYLAQGAGAKLGYSFNWYVNGPYSPTLADDYYMVAGSADEFERFRLGGDLTQTLDPVKRVIDARPPDVDESRWLEAVGSLDYIARVWRTPAEAVVEKCGKHKPGLRDVLPRAYVALRESGLLA